MSCEFEKWFWSECDELNKDTNFAYNLAERAWDYKQRKMDDLQAMFVEQARTASNQQAKIDELQKQLVDQGQRFNEQVQRIKDLEYWNNMLQKRLDSCSALIKKWEDETDYAERIAQEDFVQNTLLSCIDELQEAIKGSEE